MRLNLRFREILRLADMLTHAGIVFVMERVVDGWILVYGTLADGEVCNVSEHCYSYGHEVDRLEIDGLLTEDEKDIFGDTLGYLTAEEVFERIMVHQERR